MLEFLDLEKAAGWGVEVQERLQKAAPPWQGSTSRLVGRGSELHDLLMALASPPAACFIEGEAGIGKSRLVRELVGRGTLPAVECRAHPLRQSMPLAPLLEGVRQAGDRVPVVKAAAAGALWGLLPELEDRLPPALPALDDVLESRHRILRGLRDLMETLCPAILVVEDAHWADDISLNFLSLLLHEMPDELRVVVTFRREEATSSLTALVEPRVDGMTWLHLRLDPLSRVDTGRLIESVLGAHDISDEFVGFVYEKSGGIPFMAEELLRFLSSRGDVFRQEGRWERKLIDEIEVPPRIRDAVIARMGRLPPNTQAILEAAAIMELPAPSAILEVVADLDESSATAALTEALDCALITEAHEGYGFKHALAAQAVYGVVPGPRRRLLHLRAGRALENEFPCPHGSVATHFVRAEAPAEAARAAQVAADDAAMLGDNLGAARYLRSALAVPALDPSDRRQLAAAATTHLRDALKRGFGDAADQAAREMVDLMRHLIEESRVEHRGELRWALYSLLQFLDDSDAAQEEAIRALGELEHVPDLQARILASLSMPWQKGTLAEHQAWSDQSMTVVERCKDPVLVDAVRGNRAAFLLFVGDSRGSSEAEALRETNISSNPRERLRISVNVGFACVGLGKYAEAEAWGTIADACDPDAPLRPALLLRLFLDYARGSWNGLDRQATFVHESLASMSQITADTSLLRGLIALAHGEHSEADRLLGEAADEARRARTLRVMCAAAGGLARLHMANDASDKAGAVIAECIEGIRTKGIWVWAADLLPYAAQHAASIEDREVFGAFISEAEAGLATRDAPWAAAALAWAECVLTGDGWEGAVAALDRLPRPYEAALAREGWAQSASTGKSVQLLSESLATLEKLGASWDAGRVRAALRKQGIRVSNKRGRVGYGTELSPREREVALLAAEGRTNPDIAARLFLSPHTVANHLQAAMRKLEVRSRRDLHGVLKPDRTPN